MELNIHFDEDSQIVVATPEGNITTENVITTAKKAIEFSNQYNCDYILFDIRLCKEAQTLVEGYNTMLNLTTSTGLKHNYKLAIVYDPLKYSDKRAQFIENVVANRPNPLFKVFKSIDDAYLWMREMKNEQP